MSSFNEVDLRAIVREALSELMPEVTQSLPSAVSDKSSSASAQRSAPVDEREGFTLSETARDIETVSLRNDAELHAFVTRLLHLFENPKKRDELRQGQLRFTLGAQSAASTSQAVHRIERGAVTEATVKQAAASGAKLLLSQQAVLTPLARDRARALGVTIEKEKP